MKKEIGEIKKRLDRIEKLLRELRPQDMCDHQWEDVYGTTASVMQCEKCGLVVMKQS